MGSGNRQRLVATTAPGRPAANQQLTSTSSGSAIEALRALNRPLQIFQNSTFLIEHPDGLAGDETPKFASKIVLF